MKNHTRQTVKASSNTPMGLHKGKNVNKELILSLPLYTSSHINSVVAHNKNVVVIIDGEERKGMSTMAMHIRDYVHHNGGGGLYT